MESTNLSFLIKGKRGIEWKVEKQMAWKTFFFFFKQENEYMSDAKGNDSLEKENLIVQERRESIPGAMSLIRWKKMGSEAEREILSSLVLWLDKRIGHLWVTGDKVEHTNTGAGRWLLLHIFQFLWSRKQSHHGKVRIREEVWGAGRRRENEKAI